MTLNSRLEQNLMNKIGKTTHQTTPIYGEYRKVNRCSFPKEIFSKLSNLIMKAIEGDSISFNL